MKTLGTLTLLWALNLLFLFSCSQEKRASLTPVDLTCEYLDNPAVIDVTHPRLSWINTVREGVRGQYQSAYQIQVATSPKLLKKDQPDVWDSQKVDSDQSFLVDYDGADLTSTTSYWWRVRVWNRDDVASKWSETASWNMGLLDPAEWEAKWIGAPWQGEDPLPDPPRRFRGQDASAPPPERQWPPPASGTTE